LSKSLLNNDVYKELLLLFIYYSEISQLSYHSKKNLRVAFTIQYN